MFISKKRIATTVLAGAMAMSMAVPALAANDTKITGKYADVKIDVTVPTTGTATINPYKLDIDITKSDDTVATIKGQQIVTQPLALINKTKMVLDVDASILSTETGTFKFSDSAPAEDAKTNTAYVFLEATVDGAPKGTDIVDGVLNQDALITAFSKWAATETAGEGALVLKSGTTPVKKATADAAALCQLAAGKAGTDGVEVAATGGIAMFRLSGSVVKAPTTPWKTTDGFTTTISFTFTPVTA